MSDSLRPMDCSLPGPSVHGIFQARVLKWGAIAFSASAPQLVVLCYNCAGKLTPWMKMGVWFGISLFNMACSYGKERPGEGNDTPLQYSCLENPMDRGAW